MKDLKRLTTLQDIETIASNKISTRYILFVELSLLPRLLSFGFLNLRNLFRLFADHSQSKSQHKNLDSSDPRHITNTHSIDSTSNWIDPHRRSMYNQTKWKKNSAQTEPGKKEYFNISSPTHIQKKKRKKNANRNHAILAIALNRIRI